MSDPKVGELVVKKIQTNDSKVGKVGRSARCDQEEYMKPEQDAMLAEAGDENEFINCFDDITGKELIALNLACTTRLMSEQLWQSTTSLQSTQSGSTLTKHLREANASPFTNGCQRIQERGQARPVCGDSPTGSFQSHHIHRCESRQRPVL